MRATAVTLCLGALAIAGCGGGSTQQATAVPPTTAQTATIAAGVPSPERTATSSAAATPVAGVYRGTRAFTDVDLDQMTAMEIVPGQPEVALALTRDGVVHRVDLTGGANPTTFLDISHEIISSPGQEEGLLGLAFAPDFETSSTFYLYYTRGDPRHNRISRFVAQGDHADPASEQTVIDLPQKRFSNHNGGEITFGPDGYLYVGVGDGGSAGDPDGNGQNKNALLAKILRIDVSGDTYTIPPDNPFAGGGGAPEIYAYGFRNPWRFSFDPATGALWAGDVGQNKWEEVDRVVSGGDYGWNVMEGNHCYKPSAGCDTSGLIPPRAEYSHDDGCSITGGYVYRGTAMPELEGWFVYSDYCSGKVWAVNTADDASPPVELADTKKNVSSFFRDAAGELYLVTLDGQVFRLERHA
jgi:glucose/arabinose dehydrogenase